LGDAPLLVVIDAMDALPKRGYQWTSPQVVRAAVDFR
jgi:hypothetical protein